MLRRIASDLAKMRGVSPEDILEEFRRSIPQGEFQEPEEVAATVLFLASDEARHITGVAMIVDGGYMLGTG